MELQIHNSKTGKFVVSVDHLSKKTTIHDIKTIINSKKPKIRIERQEIRLEQRSKGVNDEDTLEKLKLKSGDKLYLKDLGIQIGWGTVFFIEYAGPLLLYLWISQRPFIFYETTLDVVPASNCAKIACYCWTAHYVKRILETLFLHRFSHGTMPLSNLFKNCAYYWGFTAYVAYHVNSPLFTPPCAFQTWIGLSLFVFSELGNLSIHVALRNLRPAGSKERKIPLPTSNPLTFLFKYVSCPNYTYEILSWVGFTIMTQCLPAGIFMALGFHQMRIWAIGKHRAYKKEFPNYPKNRKSIVPFII